MLTDQRLSFTCLSYSRLTGDGLGTAVVELDSWCYWYSRRSVYRWVYWHISPSEESSVLTPYIAAPQWIRENHYETWWWWFWVWSVYSGVPRALTGYYSALISYLSLSVIASKLTLLSVAAIVAQVTLLAYPIYILLPSLSDFTLQEYFSWWFFSRHSISCVAVTWGTIWESWAIKKTTSMSEFAVMSATLRQHSELLWSFSLRITSHEWHHK